MPRFTNSKLNPRKQGDLNTVARKRFYRSAERYLKKAESATGATADKLETLARQDFEKALDTYDPSTTQRFSEPIQRLAERFGVDLERRRKEFVTSDEELRSRRIEESQGVTQDALRDVDVRRQREARTIFNSEIGHRIIGGWVDVWRDEAITPDEHGRPRLNREKMMNAIMRFFKVETLADLLDKLEREIGDILYRKEEGDYYTTVKLELQKRIVNNTLAQ